MGSSTGLCKITPSAWPGIATGSCTERGKYTPEENALQAPAPRNPPQIASSNMAPQMTPRQPTNRRGFFNFKHRDVVLFVIFRESAVSDADLRTSKMLWPPGSTKTDRNFRPFFTPPEKDEKNRFFSNFPDFRLLPISRKTAFFRKKLFISLFSLPGA